MAAAKATATPDPGSVANRDVSLLVAPCKIVSFEMNFQNLSHDSHYDTISKSPAWIALVLRTTSLPPQKGQQECGNVTAFSGKQQLFFELPQSEKPYERQR